jgi:hypothetical protein
MLFYNSLFLVILVVHVKYFLHTHQFTWEVCRSLFYNYITSAEVAIKIQFFLRTIYIHSI